jgi:hypothetical protein
VCDGCSKVEYLSNIDEIPGHKFKTGFSSFLSRDLSMPKKKNLLSDQSFIL